MFSNSHYMYIIILVLWFSILKYLQRKNSILHPLFSLILTPLTILIIRLMGDAANLLI